MWNQPSADSPGIARAARLRGRRERRGDFAEAHRRRRRRDRFEPPRPSTMSSTSAGACIISAATSSAFCADLERRVVRGRRGHHGGARGMRADAKGDLVGLAVDDADAAVVDAERLRADLRDHGLEALAERRAAGDDLHDARRVDGNLHAVGGAEPALLHEHRNAGADQLARGAAALQHRALQLVPVGRREHLVEQREIVAGVVLDLFAEHFERPACTASRPR